jgi:hypothetical protein
MFGTAAKKNLYYIHDRQFAMAGLEEKFVCILIYFAASIKILNFQNC